MYNVLQGKSEMKKNDAVQKAYSLLIRLITLSTIRSHLER
jgi:hypothetical protein